MMAQPQPQQQAPQHPAQHPPQHSSDRKAPLVLLLDLDGTLYGKVGPILCEYEVSKWLAASGIGVGTTTTTTTTTNTTTSKRRRTTNGAANATMKALRESIVRRMRYGIIRPYVHEFCRNLPPGVELFVYTASEDSWANFVVPCVEAALGVRFNRPIFSRSHCVRTNPGGGDVGDLRKTISGLLPAIARSLGGTRGGTKRYAGVRNAADLKDRVLLVDNTAHVMADPRENARVLLCPTYSYHYGYDVLSHVPVDVLHTRFRALMPALERAGLFPEVALQVPSAQNSRSNKGANITSYQRFAAVYYRRLAKVFEATLASNSAALANDTFFLRLLHAITALVRRNATGGSMPALLTDANAVALGRSLGSAR